MLCGLGEGSVVVVVVMVSVRDLKVNLPIVMVTGIPFLSSLPHTVVASLAHSFCQNTIIVLENGSNSRPTHD